MDCGVLIFKILLFLLCNVEIFAEGRVVDVVKVYVLFAEEIKSGNLRVFFWVIER